jgi:hypothetical protein
MHKFGKLGFNFQEPMYDRFLRYYILEITGKGFRVRSLIATIAAISTPIVLVGNLLAGQIWMGIFGAIFWIVVYMIAKPKF